jgi:hypothetical protein
MQTTTLLSRVSVSTRTKFVDAVPGAGPAADASDKTSRTGHASHDVDLAPGARIAGKYVVDRVIGRGGAGIVVSAEHTLLRTRVAV